MIITILAIVIVIGGVVLAHELGHFLFAKLTGMRVEVFSLGFPPRLLGKRIGDTEYRLSAIPLGGYVKVAGVIDESMDVEGAVGDEKWKYGSKKAYQKILFVCGGVFFNLLLAIGIYSALSLKYGVFSPAPEPVVETVIPGLPAEIIGLRAGDRIEAINEQSVDSWEAMTLLIHAHPHDSVIIRWRNTEGQVFEKSLLPITNKVLKGTKLVEVGMIGISPHMLHRSANLGDALGSGLANTWYWLKITVISLKMLMTGEESIKNIGGPIFIARLAGESAKTGFSSIFGLMAVISVNLALINILPVPAFDGGHLLIILIEALTRKALSVKAKVRIQQIGLALIIALTLLVLFNDVVRLFKW